MGGGPLHFTEPQDWSFPVPIAYGPGRLSEVARVCGDNRIKAPLVVTDRGSAELPFVSRLVSDLRDAGLQAGLYSAISPNPKDTEIAAGRARFREGGHDGVIAIGGGSGMDGGKAIALTARNEIDLWAFEYERPAPDMSGQAPFPPLICIPSTAGTGAETESTAMVTDTQRLMKWCVWHPDLKPACALLDPEITLDLPVTLTAWTGADALTHAIEAYCVPGFHPLCDGAALEGLRLVARHLPEVCHNPRDLGARGAMQAGACLAGVAFMKGLGLVHALSHMIGAEYDTQHGLTNAVLLPSVLRFNASEIGHKTAPMAQAMGLERTDFDGFYRGVCDLLDQIGIPGTLAAIDVPSDGLARIARKATQDSAAGTNPRPADAIALEGILHRAFAEGR